MDIRVIVLYSSRVDFVCGFYKSLGIDFKEEKHEFGPKHYAAVMDNGTVLEIYPDSSCQLHRQKLLMELPVKNIWKSLENVEDYLDGNAPEPVKAPDGMRASIHDPDGRIVSLVQESSK